MTVSNHHIKNVLLHLRLTSFSVCRSTSPAHCMERKKSLNLSLICSTSCFSGFSQRSLACETHKPTQWCHVRYHRINHNSRQNKSRGITTATHRPTTSVIFCRYVFRSLLLSSSSSSKFLISCSLLLYSTTTFERNEI